MIAALIIGREGSAGFPGKNLYPVLGKPLAYYPMLAAKTAKLVDKVYLSTDSKKLMRLAKNNGVEVIVRPAELCTRQALGEDAFVHGYRRIRELNKKYRLESIVLLFCNSPTVTNWLIDRGIRALRRNAAYDSAVTVSRYNMWSPLRARKIDSRGLLSPFVPFEIFGELSRINCDRDSQGDVWFADMGASIVRPRCLENIAGGLLPQKWMGQKIYPLKQWGGCDVDFEWQIPMVEYWLKKNLQA